MPLAEHAEDGDGLGALALVHRHEHAIGAPVRVEGAAEDVRLRLELAVRSRPHRRVRPAELAQLPPVPQDVQRGGPRAADSSQFMNERRLASPCGARDPEGPGQLVAVVDLGAARREEEARARRRRGRVRSRSYGPPSSCELT